MGVNRKVSPQMSRGVAEMNMPVTTALKIVDMVLERWKANPSDYFTSMNPVGIEVEISNGNEIIDRRLLSDFPGLFEKIYVIIDDYGENSKEGLVVTLLLPDEY